MILVWMFILKFSLKVVNNYVNVIFAGVCIKKHGPAEYDLKPGNLHILHHDASFITACCDTFWLLEFSIIQLVIFKIVVIIIFTILDITKE